jgi:hypothetical protein
MLSWKAMVLSAGAILITMLILIMYFQLHERKTIHLTWPWDARWQLTSDDANL